MELSEKLQELRKEKGLTQEELAEALFVSRTAISKWESGRGVPNIESLKAISKFFSVSIDELLSGEEILKIADEDNKQKEKHTSDLVFGLIDCSLIMFLFLLFFSLHCLFNIGIENTITMLYSFPFRFFPLIHFNPVCP